MFRKGKKRHSSSSSQGSEISTKSKSVDSSLGGLSRSSTVASLDTDSTKSSGQSNSNFDTCTEFRVKYLGAIENLKASLFECLQGPQDLINYIDLAQQYGKLPFTPSEDESILCVSKYGIKVASSDQYSVKGVSFTLCLDQCYNDIQMVKVVENETEFSMSEASTLFSKSCEATLYPQKLFSRRAVDHCKCFHLDILHRYPLYLIVRMICYDDGLGMGKSLLAIKTTDANQNEYSICVYQCNSLEQAQTICKVLSTAFDSALSSEKS